MQIRTYAFRTQWPWNIFQALRSACSICKQPEMWSGIFPNPYRLKHTFANWQWPVVFFPVRKDQCCTSWSGATYGQPPVAGPHHNALQQWNRVLVVCCKHLPNLSCMLQSPWSNHPTAATAARGFCLPVQEGQKWDEVVFWSLPAVAYCHLVALW